METTNDELVWLDAELKDLSEEKPSERKPALKINENQLVEVDVDFSKAWDKWTDQDTGLVKKIIPLKHEGVEKVFFLNTKNPLYKELLLAGQKGMTHFKIMRTGQAKATRYILVK